jgi:hypothetical protein
MLFRRLLFLLAAALVLAGCQRAPKISNEVVAVPAARIPATAADRAWDPAPEHVAKLLLQDLVEPRLMKPSTQEVRVRAVSSDSEIAFRLTWNDSVDNSLPGAARFSDACAVQLPKKLEPNPPDPQMGQAGRPVEITFWRADWQGSVNGRGDTIRDLYPNAAVDHYPYQAGSLEKDAAAQKEMELRYSPARALGNHRSGPRTSAVEDMIAEGPGTLAPVAGASSSKGQGVRSASGWSVVISRKLPEGLGPRQRTQVAFAVWEGSAQEVGSRKMRTGWIPLLRQ